MIDTAQFVTLGIDREVFGIPVGEVQEILDMREISRLPHAPAGILGLIDVRGRSIPVVDLRSRLGLQPTEATSHTRILVLQVPLQERILQLGLVADRVFEVTDLDGGKLEPVPEMGGRWRADCIAGVGRRRGGFVIVLDLPKLLADADDTLAETAVSAIAV